MATFPSYIHHALRHARREGRYYLKQSDAAAVCFDVLADFPDCREAKELIYEIFCDEWLIYRNRIMNFERAEEYDDRPHSQRYRLAVSFRHLSHWEILDEDGERIFHDEVPDELLDVEELLEDGKMQLFVAYCMGHEPSADYAWPRFMEAAKKAMDPTAALMWIAEEYTENGYFADAADVLTELCSSEPDYAPARRLLVEVRWWRDYGAALPWIPPAGDGSRFRRLYPLLYPDRKPPDEELEYFLGRMKIVGTAPTWEPSVNRNIQSWLDAIIPDEPLLEREDFVDWSYLDEMTIEEWQCKFSFEELPESTQQSIQKMREDPAAGALERCERHMQDVRGKQYRMSLIVEPDVPKNNKPIDRDEEFDDYDDEEDEDEFDEGEEDDDEDDEGEEIEDEGKKNGLASDLEVWARNLGDDDDGGNQGGDDDLGHDHFDDQDKVLPI